MSSTFILEEHAHWRSNSAYSAFHRCFFQYLFLASLMTEKSVGILTDFSYYLPASVISESMGIWVTVTTHLMCHFSLAAITMFSLSLAFRCLAMICLILIFFFVFILRFTDLLELVHLCTHKMGIFSHYVSSTNFFCLHASPSGTSIPQMLDLWMSPQRFPMLYPLWHSIISFYFRL
jgi:hypothetical protein